jgi:hypothetical protein
MNLKWLLIQEIPRDFAVGKMGSIELELRSLVELASETQARS